MIFDSMKVNPIASGGGRNDKKIILVNQKLKINVLKLL